MSRSVYIASPEGESGKSTVALGLVNLLGRQVGKVGIFCPVTESADSTDLVVELLLAQPAVEQAYADAIGVSYQVMYADAEAALSEIVRRFHDLISRFDVLLVLGSDYTDISTPSELAFNAKVAANLGSPVVLVVHGRGRSPEQLGMAADFALTELAAAHARPVALIANRVEPTDLEAVRASLGRHSSLPVAAIPEVPVLVAPTVAALREACEGRLVRGNPAWLERESLGFVVAAMSLPNVLVRLHEDITVIAPGDRSDLLPGLVMAHQSGTFPHLSAIVLTGGYSPPEPVARLIDGVQQELPIIITDLGTFETATALNGVPWAVGRRVKGQDRNRAARVQRLRRRRCPAVGHRRRQRHHYDPVDVPVPADQTGEIRPPARGAPRR